MTQDMTMTVSPTMDPNIKVVHTKELLVDTIEHGMRGHAETNTLNEFGRMFLEIDGVVACVMAPYTIQIQKAVAFEWNEVEPHMVRLLRMFLKSRRDMMIAVEEFSKAND